MKFDAKKWMNPDGFDCAENERKAMSLINEKVACIDFFAMNAKENCKRLTGDNLISSQYDSWEFSDCIVCGAGKTCLNNLDEIAEAHKREQWHVIAVDRIHSTLKKRGITPDLTVSVDGQPKVKDFFKDVDGDDNVVMCVTQNPEVVDYVSDRAGKVWFYSALNPYDELCMELYKKHDGLAAINPGLLIGYAATDLAYWMVGEGGTIVLVGNELGWFDKKEIDVDNYKGYQLLRTKLQDGRDFYSIRSFVAAEELFKNIQSIYKDAYFVDGSIGLIRNMKKIPFREAVA